jgi:DNA invertase Pin-like site-specific DNA recombinase
MQKAIGYIRVSTNEQANQGVSLDNQRAKIAAYAVCKDLDLVEIVEDAGKSAKNLNRDGIQRVMEMLRAGEVSALIIYKLDRLTRSVKDLGYLIEAIEKAGADLMSVNDSIDTSTAAGRLVLNVMASVSQWEREAIGERTTEALSHKKAVGQVYGEVPYGYRREGDDLVKDDQEQENIGDMKALKSKGYSLRAICRELESRGIRTKKGNERWNHKVIGSIMAG